jgi:hypothetical protein
MQEFLDSIVEWSGAREDWSPISRGATLAWLLFYVFFLVYALRMHGYLFIDSANLVVHEGGHLLFGWFGRTIGLWVAAHFFRERQLAGFVFCMFFFFENWLYTATYMADARAMVLPLVTAGDSDYIEHDWNTIFSSAGVLQYDTTIGGIVRGVGWCGMLTCVGWLAARLRTTEP